MYVQLFCGLGVWAEDSKPKANEVAQIIFTSGVTTAEKVSDISGRGVGMDAAKQFLLDTGGSIEIALLGTEPDDNDCIPFEILITLPADLLEVPPSALSLAAITGISAKSA